MGMGDFEGPNTQPKHVKKRSFLFRQVAALISDFNYYQITSFTYYTYELR